MSGSAPDHTCFLVRHCDVENPERILYGHLPGFGLSARGRRQAGNLGRYLRNFDLAGIYVSPLQRARETAELLARELPTSPPLEVREDLVEAEFGRYLQGTRYRDVPWRKPRWLAHMVFPGLVPGDEAMSAMARRVERIVREGLKHHRGRTFACISHGDPIQAFWATSEGRGPWALHRLQCAKGGLLRLDFQGDRLLTKTYLSPTAIEAAGGGAVAARSASPEPAEVGWPG